jgi:hypothetical protein
MAEWEGTVVEEVVLGAKPGDWIRAHVVTSTAAVQVGQPAEVHVAVRHMFVATPLGVRGYEHISYTAFLPVMP